ncbi:hypothetical protein LTR08_000603 [Meristemomyces frigidus]|nr:hypothetical protein LTR08_000603 [Meristemomyces frigidus]
MAVQEAVRSSEELRKQGNELYKRGKFEDAVPVYKRAAESAPTDAAPVSNLAAAYFELGQYDVCMAACKTASELLAPQSGSTDAVALAKLQKLLIREAKAALNTAQLDRAERVLLALPASEDTAAMEKCVGQLRKAQAGDAKGVLSKLILELPRCKPMIRNVPEYFHFGHDTPESLYGVNDEVLRTERKKISFLFGGIGDARNLHRTMDGKCFHFTVVDHKPAAIARDILVLLMLDEISKNASVHALEDNQMIAIICLYYTYLAPIMPDWVYHMLQTYIAKAMSALESPAEFPTFLDVPQLYRAGVSSILREWQSEVQEEYPTKRVRLEAIRQRLRDRTQRTLRTGKLGLEAPKDCEKQEAFYRATGVLFMEFGGKPMHGTQLNAAYSEFDEKSPDTFNAELLEGLDTAWRTNVTLVDLEWQRNREGWDGSPETAASHMDINVLHNPFEFAMKLAEERTGMSEGEGMFHRMLNWFHSVARAMKQLQGRYKIEVCVGDVNSVLEQVRYGVVGHRSDQQNAKTTGVGGQPALAAPSDLHTEELSEYPLAYDRIHLSNIPDYVGGSLSSFLYALPVTYTGDFSYITSCCLRNPPLFRTPRHFTNEYVGLSDSSDLAKLFHAKMEPLQFPEDAPLVMSEYIQWHRCDSSTNFADLISRPELEAWLYRLFLKLAIPKERKSRDFVLIYSPLNLTAYVRLCNHLHDIGYPAHWIGSVLSSILSGTITCKARPPRSDPLDILEVQNEARREAIEQCTAPFVAELSTLLSMWQQAGALPFGILSTALPDIELVHKYSVTFDAIPDLVAETPSFVLLLFDAELLPPGSNSIRKFLLSDEKADLSSRGKAIRERGLHVISTWDWHRGSKTATFWLRRDVLESVISGHRWGPAIWRTDNWTIQGMPQRMEDVRDLGVWLQD